MPQQTEKRCFERGDLKVTSLKGSISSTAELEAAAAILSVPPPEICFGNNRLLLEHPAFSYSFDAVAALALVDPTGDDRVQVAHAGEWAKSRNLGEADGVKVVQKWDWTYTTLYEGTFAQKESSSSLQAAPVSHPGIPLKKLASQDEPILFFDEVTLFEDELHDCGMANLTVKVRVMPSFVFVLSRFFLRVDHVLFRIFDVRLYHAFGSSELLREVRGREAAYDEVKRRLPRDKPDDLTPLTDSNWVANVLGMLEDARPAQAIAPSTMAPGVRDYLAGSGTRQQAPAPQAAPFQRARRKWKGQAASRLEVYAF